MRESVKINLAKLISKRKINRENQDFTKHYRSKQRETITNFNASFHSKQTRWNELFSKRRIMFYVKYSPYYRLFFGKKISLSNPDVQQLLFFNTKCWRRAYGKSRGITNCGTDKLVSFIHWNFERKIFYAFDIRSE